MMTPTHRSAEQSDHDHNPAFRGWARNTLPRDPAALDRLADVELAHGHYRAADHLAWLAAGMREVAR